MIHSIHAQGQKETLCVGSGCARVAQQVTLAMESYPAQNKWGAQ